MVIFKKTENVKACFYRLRHEQDIQNWISSCQQCQKRNLSQPAPKAHIGTIKAKHPFEKLPCDNNGPFTHII